MVKFVITRGGPTHRRSQSTQCTPLDRAALPCRQNRTPTRAGKPTTAAESGSARATADPTQSKGPPTTATTTVDQHRLQWQRGARGVIVSVVLLSRQQMCPTGITERRTMSHHAVRAQAAEQRARLLAPGVPAGRRRYVFVSGLKGSCLLRPSRGDQTNRDFCSSCAGTATGGSGHAAAHGPQRGAPPGRTDRVWRRRLSRTASRKCRRLTHERRVHVRSEQAVCLHTRSSETHST